MMYHAALPQQKQLRRQLFIVAVDLADHIASIRSPGPQWQIPGSHSRNRWPAVPH